MASATLQKQGQIEHRIRIIGCDPECPLETVHRLLPATLLIEKIREIVPRLGELRVGLQGSSKCSLGFDLAPLCPKQVAEIVGRRGVPRVSGEEASVETLRSLGIARLFGRLRLAEKPVQIGARSIDGQNELASNVGSTT